MNRLLVLALALSAALCAQEFRGSLSGHVTDPSGAVVASAAIQAVNQSTNQSYSATTTEAGTYLFPYVLPGNYQVTASAPGFKKHISESVVINANAALVLNVQLEMGATTETIVVSDTPPLLNAENAVGNDVLTTRELETLPLNGRQIYTVLGTTTGSQFLQTQFGAGGYSGTRAWDVSNNYTIGGGVQGYQQFTLNGSNITLQNHGSQGEWTLAPNVDALQEVNVQTTNYDARYGRSGGGFVNMVMKSGGNQMHGTLYEYLKNGDLNANNFESNLNGIPRQKVVENQFGGTVGGPIKKDKIFYFGSYEGYRQAIPFTTQTSVAPDYLRTAGDVDFNRTGYTIYDPLSTACVGGSLDNCPSNTYTRTAFPGNVIPANRISDIGRKFLNLYPHANINTNSLTDNYITSSPDKYSYNQYMGRVDYDTSDKTRWYTMASFQKGSEFRNSSGFTGPAINGNIDNMRSTTTASQDMTHTFSPTFLMDAKVTFNRFVQEAPNGDINSDVTATSFGLNMPKVPTTTKDLLPEVTFTSMYPQMVGNNSPRDVYNAYIFGLDFTKTAGKHNFKFGGEIAQYQYGNPNSVGNANGTFKFGTGFSQSDPKHFQAGTGMVLADLLMGYPNSGGVDYNNTLFEYFPTYALYAQDDWHVTRRLTLNFGVRYDIQGGLAERHNGLNRGLCTTCVNQTITNNAQYQQNLAKYAAQYAAAGVDVNSLKTVYGVLQFAGAQGNPSTAFNTDYTNFGPRFGFAFQADKKTVIRGGYGMMFAVGLEGGTTEGFSHNTGYTTTLNSGLTPTNYFQSGTPYPNGITAPVGANGGDLTGLGNSSTSLDFPGRKIPRAQQFSIGVQRELPANMTLDARFVGNYTDRLRTFVWMNGTFSKSELDAAVANPNIWSQNLPNPFYGVVPASTWLGGQKSLQAVRLMQGMTAFGLLGQYNNPLGRSRYNGLEVKLDKRLSQGLSLRAGYTFSKTLEQTGYQNGWPYQDAEMRKQVPGGDRTHVFTLTTRYDVPTLHSSDKLAWSALRATAKDWSISWVLTAESGVPVSLNTGYEWVSGHSWTPDGGPSLKQWLYNCNGNPSACWASHSDWQLSTMPERISTLRMPSVPNVDFSLERAFPIYEKYKLVARGEAFNLTNSVLFGSLNNDPGQKISQGANGWWTGYGTISSQQYNFPRMVQLSLKLRF